MSFGVIKFLEHSVSMMTSSSSDYIQPDYTIASNGLPNILNKNRGDRTIRSELAFKTIIDNTDSNKKLLKMRNSQLNNQINNEMFAITVNQRKMSTCTSELEQHGRVDKKIKEKYNMRIRDCRVDGT